MHGAKIEGRPGNCGHYDREEGGLKVAKEARKHRGKSRILYNYAYNGMRTEVCADFDF